jgi:hypothetical protein
MMEGDKSDMSMLYKEELRVVMRGRVAWTGVNQCQRLTPDILATTS